MRTSCTTRIPSEMLKLKGNKPGHILSSRSSHKGAQNPSAVGLPFHCTCPFFLSSVQDPYRSDLCFQSLTTWHLYCQCLCVHILILTERTMNSKIKIKIKTDITTHTPKCKPNSEYHLKCAAKPHWFCCFPSTCFSFVLLVWISHSQGSEVFCRNSVWYFINNYCCFMGKCITKFQWLRIPGLIAFCRMTEDRQRQL